MSPTALLLVHLGATLFMTGLIWFVQLVHYPLFAGVGTQGWVTFAASHTRRTRWVVGPPMLVEAAASLLLVVRRPAAVPAAWAWIALGLLAVVWLSTAFVQVPRHRLLADGYDPATVRALVATNWLRTAAWSARAALTLAMVARAMA